MPSTSVSACAHGLCQVKAGAWAGLVSPERSPFPSPGEKTLQGLVPTSGEEMKTEMQQGGREVLEKE